VELEDAYQTLKNCLDLDDQDVQEAYQIVINDPDGYRSVVLDQCEITKSSIEVGQSSIGLGEIIRQFYNATHRQINDEIIDLPGADLCEDVGKVASESINKTIQINKITEEWANTQISINDTVDMSYV